MRLDVSEENPRKIDYSIINKVYKAYDVDFSDDDRNLLGGADTERGGTSAKIDRFDDIKYSDLVRYSDLERRYKEKRTYTRHQFRLVFNRIVKEYDILKRRAEKFEVDPDYSPGSKEISTTLHHSRRLRELWKGQNIDLIKNNKGYFLRR